MRIHQLAVYNGQPFDEHLRIFLANQSLEPKVPESNLSILMPSDQELVLVDLHYIADWGPDDLNIVSALDIPPSESLVLSTANQILPLFVEYHRGDEAVMTCKHLTDFVNVHIVKPYSVT